MKENKKKPSSSTTPKAAAAVIEEKENVEVITPKLEVFNDENADLEEVIINKISNQYNIFLIDFILI